jgi:hypothetical protein
MPGGPTASRGGRCQHPTGKVALALVGGKAWVPFSATGFTRVTIDTIAFYHTTPDCSDVTTRYLDAADVPARGYVLPDDTAYVPILNQPVLTFRSFETFATPPPTPETQGVCTPITDYTTLATGYNLVPVSDLGTPPFSIR